MTAFGHKRQEPREVVLTTKRIDDETVISYSPDMAQVDLGGLCIQIVMETDEFTHRDMQHVAMGMYVALNQLKGVVLKSEWDELARRYADYMNEKFPEDLPDNVVRLFDRDKGT